MLLAFLINNAGILTIIRMATIYGQGIGLGTGGGKITLIVDEPIEKREALEIKARSDFKNAVDYSRKSVANRPFLV